ncbi:MAG TPA: protein kinase [Kofleriaceae bacterium]|nr:protein kinase [Kofleriaceae bacterium]
MAASTDEEDGLSPAFATRSAAREASAFDAGGETVAAGAEAEPKPGARRAAHPVRDASRYQIIGEHGRGGLGRVFRARDLELERDVAIKELLARDVMSELRFQREALITARLEHPGIVPVHEAGRWADGAPFYAMKLVSGRPLRELIAERPTVEQRIELLHHVIAVADAIAYAHDHHIIHRDLKPANVIVGEFGETIVIDWGLAKDLSTQDGLALGSAERAADRDEGLTNAGHVMGTPSYMAPEQLRGERVDRRADVFAIGAMLWELCATEKLPATVAERHRRLRAAGIDRDLITILDKALASDPGQRYPHAGALAADLKAFKSGARITARHYSLWAVLAHWTRRHRAAAAAALAIAVLVVASLAALAVSYRAALQTRAAEQLAEATYTQAELEQGRAALLHHEPEAQRHLSNAYKHAPTPSTAFMLARAEQPALAELAKLPGTSGRVHSATFSPDGHRIVVTDDKAAQVWDGDDYHLLFTLPHSDTVYDAVYSRDGKLLFTLTGDAVRVWNAATGSLVRTLRAERKVRYSVLAVSSDGARAAAMGQTGDWAHVWDVETGAALAELHEDPRDTPMLAFNADGRWLAASGRKEIHVYDTATWKPITVIPGPDFNQMMWDPTGARIATCNGWGDVSLWAVPSGERLHQLRALGDPVDAVAFSPDGQLVAAAVRDGTVYVWRADTGAVRSHGNFLQNKMLSVDFDPSSTRLVVASGIGQVAVADPVLGMPIAILDGPRAVILRAQFDAASKRVVGASWDGTARVWAAGAPYQRWQSPQASQDCGEVTSLESDRRFLAVQCRKHPTRIWDTEREQLVAELPAVTSVDGDFDGSHPAVSVDGARAAIPHDQTIDIYELPAARVVRTIAHPAAVNTVAFAPSGHDVISGSIDGTLIVSHDDGTQVELPRMPAGIDAAVFWPDGRLLASDAQRHLRVHDARGAIVGELGLAGRARMLRSSTDGHRLLAVPTPFGSAAATELWDLEARRRVVEIPSDVGVWGARLIDGDILTANADGTVKWWDGATGALRQTYRGGTRFLVDVLRSPDGAMVIAGGGDGLLRFWDAASGLPLWNMVAHKSFLVGIQYRGGDLVTRGFGGEIARWSLPPAETVIAACERHVPCASRAR